MTSSDKTDRCGRAMRRIGAYSALTGRRLSAGGVGVSPTTDRASGWEELRPPEIRVTQRSRLRAKAREGVCGSMNYRIIVGGEVVPRRVKQATAMKTPLETPDLPCISGKFSLVRECTTGELPTRNKRGTSPPWPEAMLLVVLPSSVERAQVVARPLRSWIDWPSGTSPWERLWTRACATVSSPRSRTRAASTSRSTLRRPPPRTFATGAATSKRLGGVARLEATSGLWPGAAGGSRPSTT